MGTWLSRTSEVIFQLLFLRFNKDRLKLTYPSNKREHCQDSLQSTDTAWPAWTAATEHCSSIPSRQAGPQAPCYLRYLLLTSVIGVLLQSNRTSHQVGAKSQQTKKASFIKAGTLMKWFVQLATGKTALPVGTKSKKTRGEHSRTTVQKISRVLRTRKHGKI